MRSRRRHQTRRRRWVIALIAVAALALLGVTAYRYTSALLALTSGQSEVQSARQLLGNDPSRIDAERLGAAATHLDNAVRDFGTDSDILANGWLAWIAGHLPWLSDQVSAANRLRDAGKSGSQAAVDVVRLARYVLPAGSNASGGSPLQRIVSLADRYQGDVRRAVADLATFHRALSAVPRGHLFGPLENTRSTVLTEGTKFDAAAGPALAILNALPESIGHGTHRYLVLLENPGEERPSGGYIGAVGVVSFTDGGLSGLRFDDSATYAPPQPAVPAPDALDRYLFHGEPWGLEDANWSPDFASSMADVERFYTAHTGQTVDGDISIDPIAIEYLLQVLGQVQVPSYPQVITSSNALLELNYITNYARPGDPGKAFLAPFGQRLTEEVLRSSISTLPEVANALQRAATEKHLVVFFHNGPLEHLVTAAGVGGAVQPSTSDSVMVDDANLSGTKGDLFVKRQFHLQVDVHPDGTAEDQLTLDYTNPAVTDAADRALVPNSGAQYRDYARILIPETAQLESVTASINNGTPTQIAPDAIVYQFQQLTLGLWFVVPVNGEEHITVTYRGPFADISVNPERYALTWTKQVNALSWPATVNVRMPSRRTYSWSTTLTTDRSWSASN